MEVVVTMRVTAEELYRVLMDSLKHDIEQSTNSKISDKAIKTGYKYSKNLKNKVGQVVKSTATLSRIERPYVYEVQFQTDRGLNTVSYVIEESDSENIQVTYSEVYDASSKSHATNFSFMSKIFTAPAKRKVKAFLQMMEAYILQNRSSGAIEKKEEGE